MKRRGVEMSIVKTGLSLINDNIDLFRGKKIGLLTNATAVDDNLRTILDVFSSNAFNTVRVFGPEHGFWGAAPDGERVSSSYDHRYGVEVVSLYGEKERPDKEELEDLDIIVYDIQDVGLRFYTYLYSLAYMMEECGKLGIQVVVLDRPNPLGDRIEGPIIEPDYNSFVGGYSIPVRYGLTIGELAQYFNKAFDMGVDLRVIEMKGYRKEMYYDQTGLHWSTPSPNLPALEHTILFSGFCMLEGVNVSVGRGTVHPFKYVGAPWIEPGRLLKALKSFRHEGVAFRERAFVPSLSKYKGELCQGVEAYVTDREKIKPLSIAIDLVHLIYTMFTKDFEWDTAYHEAGGRHHFDLITGNGSVRRAIESGEDSKTVLPAYEQDTRKFEERAKEFRIY